MKRSTNILLAACMLLSASFAVPARAQAPAAPPREAPSIWLYALYKGLTYETVVNLVDVPLYPMVLTGARASGVVFNAVNATTALAAYYSYEVAWHFYGPPIDGPPVEALKTEIQKTVIYRGVSTARNIALAYAFTGSYSATFAFVVVTNVVDTILYAANEYGWYRYGPPIATVWGKGASIQDAIADWRKSTPPQPR